MGIETQLENDLDVLGVDVFEQGTWPGEIDLPDSFVTYTIVDSVDIAHFGNRPFGSEWQIQVNVYSTDPDILETLRESVIAQLLECGYTRDGRGYGGELEAITGRFPWYLVFYKFEKESGV